jgi:hypothetical protein
VAKNQLNFTIIIFSRNYIVLRKKKFDIFFLQNVVNRGSLYDQKKNFEKIDFKYFKIAIKYDCSNLFAPTVDIIGERLTS